MAGSSSGGGSNNEVWRKMAADTHKMKPDQDGKAAAAGVEASKRPPGQRPGGVLHQRRNLPFSLTKMALAGLAITAVTAYFTLYVKKKPEATAGDVAKVTTGIADDPPEIKTDRPRK